MGEGGGGYTASESDLFIYFITSFRLISAKSPDNQPEYLTCVSQRHRVGEAIGEELGFSYMQMIFSE